MIPGYTTRVTSGGVCVLRWHYSASPHKRPGTPEGDEWLKEESRVYLLGMEDPRWKKEMEIQYSAMGGAFLFPLWEKWRRNGQIVVEPFPPVGYRLFASYDHGWANPACFHVHGMDSDGRFTLGLYEFYADHVPAHLIADIIKGKDVTTQDGRRFRGNPWPSDISFIIADPSIWAEDLPQHNGPNKSTAKIFRECGVPMVPGERGGDATIAEWLHGYFWKDPQAPLLRIACYRNRIEKRPEGKYYSGFGAPMLVWEIGQQRNKEFSAQVALNRNNQEEFVDKDNHAWDSIKYFLKRFPPPDQKKRAEAHPNSFAWWRKQAQRASKGEFQRNATFRIGV